MKNNPAQLKNLEKGAPYRFTSETAATAARKGSARAQALAAQDMLIVHFYAGESATPFAERYASCMVEVTGLGGEGGGNIGMPISVTYGGTRTTGTASRDASTGAVTFQAA